MKNRVFVISLIAFLVLFIAFFIYKTIIYDYFVVPKIDLLGDQKFYINLNQLYNDPGYDATIKNKEANKLVKVVGKVDNTKVGIYKINYSITNHLGKQKQTKERLVIVKDSVAPILSLTNGNEYTQSVNTDYVEPGYMAIDNIDNDITKNVKITGNVDTKKIGTYELTYKIKDTSLNETVITRIIHIVDNIKPQITLKGNNPLYLKINEPYIEPGYIATDNYEGDVTKAVLVTSNVNTNVAGVYNVNYAVQDDALNYNSLNRQVYVGTTAEISDNTYIAVSIENQYIWFYKNGIVITSAPIVSGTRNRYDTPRGTYQILSKATSIYLTGPGYKSYVNYWLRFTSSQIGLHDAPWRSYFGGSAYIGNGSHGCVNLPYYTARIIYQNAPIGTRVVVY